MCPPSIGDRDRYNIKADKSIISEKWRIEEMKMMKKKGILATVLAMLLVLGSMTVSAWAETTPTTVNDETSLRNALQSGGAIELGNNIAVTGGDITVAKDTTIDLNGKAIRFDAHTTGTQLVIAQGVNLTINDSSADKKGIITSDGTIVMVDTLSIIKGHVENKGTLTLNAGTLDKGLKNTGTFNMNAGTINNGLENSGTFNMKGGDVSNSGSSSNKVIVNSGTMFADGGTVSTYQGEESYNSGTITVSTGCEKPTVFGCNVNNEGSGKITGGAYNNIVRMKSADAEISGGTFSNTSYVDASAGKITDGTFNCTVTTNYENAGATVSGGIFYGTINFNYDKVQDSAYSVIYNTNDGSAVTPARVIRGQKTTKPTDPTKKGCVFKGWYKDAGLTEEFTFGNSVTGDAITVYAGWDTCCHIDSTDQPTCTEGATCTVCGGTIEKLGHSFVKKGNVWKCVREGCNEERSIADGPIIEIKGSDKIFNNLDYTFSFDVPANYTFAGVGYNFEKSGGGLIPLEKGNTYTATVEKKYYAVGEKSFNVFAKVQDKEHGDYFTEYKDVQLLEQKGESPKTGDNSNMFLWLALLLVGGGAFTATTLASKRG